MIIICAVSAKTLLMANPERETEKKKSIRLHRHHHRRRKRRRRLSFDTVVIHIFFLLFLSFIRCDSVAVYVCVYVWIEIWIENCYHKHIWLGRFLYARTQFAVNSTTENIINHFGSFSACFFRSPSISMFRLAFFPLSFAHRHRRLLLNFIPVVFLPARKLVM